MAHLIQGKTGRLQGTKLKGQGTRDKGQGTRDKGQGTRDEMREIEVRGERLKSTLIFVQIGLLIVN
jgi:hypothetical protein